MEILRELEELIAGGLGPWPEKMIAGGGGGSAVKADEELHPFLAASLHRAVSGPLLAVVPGRAAQEELSLLLAELLGAGAVRPLPFRELVIAGEHGEDPEAVALRARALRALGEGEHVVVVCEARALSQRFPAEREGQLASFVRGRGGEGHGRDGTAPGRDGLCQGLPGGGGGPVLGARRHPGYLRPRLAPAGAGGVLRRYGGEDTPLQPRRSALGRGARGGGDLPGGPAGRARATGEWSSWRWRRKVQWWPCCSRCWSGRGCVPWTRELPSWRERRREVSSRSSWIPWPLIPPRWSRAWGPRNTAAARTSSWPT